VDTARGARRAAEMRDVGCHHGWLVDERGGVMAMMMMMMMHP
jgi:hypothetical protein